MSRKKVAIGIDLGTTKCCVGVVRDGKVEILENERAKKTTPSYVAFTGNERLIGEDAKDQATLNARNTVFGIKGIIGRGLEDDQVEIASNNMPYVIADNAGDPCIKVTYKLEEEVLFPQQVTAMLLTKMKKMAETRLRCSVQGAVISVPASFSNAQRQATKDAATIAGLEVLALINEPTAAAIAYQANRKENDNETIAVVDFGGGKLDIAIVSITSATVTVKSVSGTMDLGGNAVDEILMTHVLDSFRGKFSQDPPNGASVMERLRSACVKLKHSLSLLPKVQDQLDCFGEDFLLPISISRREYDGLISSMISSCMSTHFARACTKKRNISRVVLVGGSTRIPLVPEEVQRFFDGIKQDRSVNPDEAVAQGAAIYAALLSGDNTVTELAVHDILPNTFCMGAENTECVQDLFTAPHIPSKGIHRFSDKEMEQKQTFYEVLAGRKDSHKLLGTLCLSQDFARAVSIVDKVCFEINNCGVFDIHVHLNPNHLFHDVLHNNTTRLGKSKLKDAIEREKMFRKDDEDEEDRIAAVTDLETKCFDLQSAMLTSRGRTRFPKLVEEIVEQTSETIDWLDTIPMVTRIECLGKIKYLRKLERNLQEKLEEIERLEKERAASENNLRMYCTQLEEVVKDENYREEVELVAQIGELVKQTRGWLQTNEIPSKTDCDEKTTGLEKIHLKLKTNVQERQQERARLAAIEDLKCQCAILQKALTTKQRSEQDMTRVDKLVEKTKAVLNWLFSDSDQSQAACEAKKIALDNMLLEIQNLEREAEERERMRETAVESLKTYCHEIRTEVENCRMIESDVPAAAQLVTEVIATLTWLQEGRNFSQSQCEEKGNHIRSLLTAIHEVVHEEEQVKFQKREDERKTALTKFQAHHSYIKSSFLTEAVKRQHSDLANSMLRLEHDITEWLETTKTFTVLEFEGKLEPLARIYDILVALSDERKKQLLVEAQQDVSSERPAPSIDAEGAVLNARDKDEKNGDPKRSSKEEKDQSNQMDLIDAQEEKNGNGGSKENKAGSMEQEGAKGSFADCENHSNNNNGNNDESNETRCNEEQN